MKVLVACEFSGMVRDAFRARGHFAMSCDLLPDMNGPNPAHATGDVRRILREGWDLVIAHPPCTFLCNSGARWLYRNGRKENGPDFDRWRQLSEAREFFQLFLNLSCKVAIENPIPHIHAGLPPPTQIIQPYQFGHGETKATCLWLVRLPPLRPTEHVAGRVPRVHHMPPGPDRSRLRSITYSGIAAAMAEQWG